jgi:hypothetical protein
LPIPLRRKSSRRIAAFDVTKTISDGVRACRASSRRRRVRTFKPCRIETFPDARLTIDCGIKNGENSVGSARKEFIVFAFDAQKSPMPELM